MLILNSSNSFWGSETSLLVLLEGLDVKDYNLFIQDSKGNFDYALECRNIPFSKVALELSPYKWGFYKSVFKLLMIVFKYRERKVYCNNDDLSTLVAALKISTFFWLKTFVHVRNIPGSRYYYKKLMFLHNRVICNSNYTKEHLVSDLPLSKDNLSVVPNPHGQKHKAINFFSDPPIENKYILTLGRLQKNKAQLEVIKILQQKNLFSSNIEYLLVGGASDSDFGYKEQIKEYLKTNSIQSKVHMHGFSNEVSHYYKHAELVIIPSYIETFGRVVIEAGFWKVPVIVRNIGSLCEIVDHGKTGLVWDGSSEQLSEQIKSILQDEEYQTYLGNNLHKKVIDQYSDDRYIKRLKKIVGM